MSTSPPPPPLRAAPQIRTVNGIAAGTVNGGWLGDWMHGQSGYDSRVERLEEAERERERRSRERLRDAEVSQYEARQGLLREMDLLRAREQVVCFRCVRRVLSALLLKVLVLASLLMSLVGVLGVGVGVDAGLLSRQTDRQAGRQAGRPTGRHNGRQTDR